MEGDAPLAGDWMLWRDFAVRSAGFPVAGLEAFGPGDESARLRTAASDPRFQEAVTWQNPAALRNAVLKIAEGQPTKPSKTRQREDIVASYWQRYCGKNDTIGFYGPLAWGRIADDGPALEARFGPVEREREVHLEAWPVQALAEVIDPELKIATGPYTERDLRAALEAHSDPATRERGLEALARLEARRDALAAATPEALLEELDALDRTFVELTDRDPVRNQGRAYGARTLSYPDSMRDVDVTLGPGLTAELAPALQTLFEATRWYCGQIHEIGRAVIKRFLPEGGKGPFIPVMIDVVKTLMQLPPELDEVSAEFHRRLATVLADPDPATVGSRAIDAFSDHVPAWTPSVFQSVDIQLAAPDAAAVEAGEYLAVIGDVHPGDNPLRQGLFAHRHPDTQAFLEKMRADLGGPVVNLLPPWNPQTGLDARGVPLMPEDDVHIAALPDTRAEGSRHTWLSPELMVDGEDLVDRAGSLRVPLIEAFALPIFVTGVRSFELLPEQDHSERVAIGRVVIQREGWSVEAAEIPDKAEDIAAFARDRGMPRRMYMKSPLERKPMYLDTESSVLPRILCRQARQAAAGSPQARIRFTEMLPSPDECWLRDDAGNCYVSEFRIVAVDQSR